MNYDDLRIAIRRREKLKQNIQAEDRELDYIQHSIHTYLKVSLPETWNRADEDFVKVKYPNQSNPAEVFTGPGYRADFMIQMDQSIPLMEEEIEKFKNSMRDMIMRLQPANSFYGEGDEDLKGLKICWFDFGSYGLDGMVYNLIFFTAVKGVLSSGSFHCKELEAVVWKPLFFKVLRSLNYMEVSDESRPDFN